MLELMKQLGFIPESKAIQLQSNSLGVYGSRYDRVTYLKEKLDITVISLHETTDVYVEADKFLALLPYITQVKEEENFLLVNTQGGGVYKLPYLDVTFPVFDCTHLNKIIELHKDLEGLKKTALNNLVKPEMRCIYVDRNHAVSCNFLQGTVDSGVTSVEPVLLPVDLYAYIQQPGVIYTAEDLIIFSDFQDKSLVVAPYCEFQRVEEGEEPWFSQIAQLAESSNSSRYVEVPQNFEDSLKRLQLFNNDLTITPTKLISGENEEPCALPFAETHFKIDRILSVMQGADKMTIFNGNLYFKNGSSIVLISEDSDETV